MITQPFLRDFPARGLSVMLLITACIGLTTGQSAKIKKNSLVAAPIKWETSPFKYSILDDLPPKYYGHSFDSVLQVLFKERANLIKDEFESTNAYTRRLAAMRSTPLVGQASLGSRLAFNFMPHERGFESGYNADSEMLTVSSKWDRHYGFGTYPDAFFALTWTDSTKTIGSYTGRNAFNAKLQVKVQSTQSFHLISERKAIELFFPSPPFGMSQLTDTIISGKLPIKPSAARGVKANLRMLVIGHLADIFLLTASTRSTPTITVPQDELKTEYGVNFVIEEVWVYDFETGKVLIRFGPRQ